MMHHVYIGLGSNLGDRRQNITEAIRLIGERVGTVVAQSSLSEFEPWGFQSEHPFLNGAIHVETHLSPFDVLAATQQIERELGKTERHATKRSKPPHTSSPSDLSPLTSHHPPQYKDRPIDIDILLYDDLHQNNPRLTLPHPMMYERPFVMKPLKEILKFT